MSTKLQATGEDYPEAVLKHCEDARHLLSGNRSDGAAYLAGYAVECALKTLVQVEKGNAYPVRQWNHRLNDLSAEALRLAVQPTNKTFRYLTNRSSLTTLRYDNPPAGWKERLRYYPAGTIPAPTAEQWVQEAERLYVEIIGELKKDGEI
jgi:HEPN domain-containing protein